MCKAQSNSRVNATYTGVLGEADEVAPYTKGWSGLKLL